MTTPTYARMAGLVRLRRTWHDLAIGRSQLNAPAYLIKNAYRNMETVEQAARDLIESDKCGPKTRQLYKENFQP